MTAVRNAARARSLHRPAVVATILAAAAYASADATPATKPAATPTTTPSTGLTLPNVVRELMTGRRAGTRSATQAVVAPAAAALLERVAAAYAADAPRHWTGHVVGTFDVAGRRRTFTLAVDGRTDGHGRFRHDTDSGLAVSDGQHAYLYDRRRDAFAELNAVPGRQAAADAGDALVGVLLDENPALLLSVVDDAAALLKRSATHINVATLPTATSPATQSARVPTAGLVLVRGEKTITLWIDDAGEVVGSRIDYRPLMTARHAADVKAASVALTYDTVAREPAPADAFTWEPPASAAQLDAGEDERPPAKLPATRPTATRPTPAATTVPTQPATPADP